MARIHKIEGYPCKHKAEVKGNAFKKKGGSKSKFFFLYS